VAEWAGRQLALWLSIRERQLLPGGFVFHSMATVKPWSHPACHGAIVVVLQAVGITGGNPFRLRHTFAARQLGKGFSEDQVARWMGYVNTKPMKRYRHLITRPVSAA
jgi:integrase